MRQCLHWGGGGARGEAWEVRERELRADSTGRQRKQNWQVLGKTSKFPTSESQKSAENGCGLFL